MLAKNYDPRLPSLTSIQAKHWISMISQDKYLSEVFKMPPITAYIKERNIRDHIIRGKVARPLNYYPKIYLKGMSNCGTNCTACPYIKQAKVVQINGEEWTINKQYDCNS